MLRNTIAAFAALTLTAFAAIAQDSFDTSGNSQLNGTFFVREVLIGGQSTSGAITSATSATGILTFDGKGNYSFTGQLAVSTGNVSTQTFTGIYKLGATGLFVMTSLIDETDACYGGVAGIGPSAIVASATEGNNVDLLIAIPTGSGFSNSSLNGAYSGAFIDFTSANIGQVRQASFKLNANGAGSFGTVAATGTAVNLGGTQITQNIAGATYSLTGSGSGTATFGASSTAQLLSGTRNLYVSPDGNILLGGNPAGFDMFVAIRGLTGNASNATANGLYFVGAIEDFVGGTSHSIDAFYGSANANGNGTTLNHNRLQSFTDAPFDFTFDSEYTVQTNGTISSTDIPFYNVAFGAGGKAFVATGAQGLYTLQVGFGSKTYSGSGVFINPTGIVNAASFAPITNPVAPNEIVTMFGTGLASGTVSASSLPLPTSLGGVQVNLLWRKVHDPAVLRTDPAPLFYVTPTQIAFLIPPSIRPDLDIANVTFEVTNNGVKSNQVTLYTAFTAPGVFSTGGNGIRAAAATHVNGTLITAASPAAVGETIVVYAGGLGTTTPAVAPGAAAPSNPLARTDDDLSADPNARDRVEFSGQSGSITFNGLTPGLSGLYQINVAPVAGTSNGTVFVNIATPDAFTNQTTTVITGGAAPRGVQADKAQGDKQVAPRPLALRAAAQRLTGAAVPGAKPKGLPDRAR